MKNRSASLPAIWWEHESTKEAILGINNWLVVVSLFLILIAREIWCSFALLSLSIKPRGIMGQYGGLMANITTNFGSGCWHVSQLCVIAGANLIDLLTYFRIRGLHTLLRLMIWKILCLFFILFSVIKNWKRLFLHVLNIFTFFGSFAVCRPRRLWIITEETLYDRRILWPVLTVYNLSKRGKKQGQFF